MSLSTAEDPPARPSTDQLPTALRPQAIECAIPPELAATSVPEAPSPDTPCARRLLALAIAPRHIALLTDSIQHREPWSCSPSSPRRDAHRHQPCVHAHAHIALARGCRLSADVPPKFKPGPTAGFPAAPQASDIAPSPPLLGGDSRHLQAPRSTGGGFGYRALRTRGSRAR
ncbi:hypothetical protein C2E23DRAFT_196025 [Lenzites betulinus]|nr:hypothetical protein C2E23DRAFT_196025 [Lenzites betulinus]